jgi:phage tail sheath protein FI
VDGPKQAAPPPELEGLLLDPRDPAELARIVEYQRRLADLVETVRSFVVLLDVPPGLDQRQILLWRAQFATSYAAAYHPWLDIARSDGRGLTRRRLNPSAVAAGIIAHRELVLGVPYGPSNEIAARAVDVADAVSPARHDELHPAGINVFLRERDGIVLTAARTLSTDPSYRQLSVRRLMTMLVRTLEREFQWVVFEPNNDSLRANLRHILRTYLRRLYRANAFAGATEDEAFFVRCDETVNTQASLDAGQLVAEIGVAPAEPLEFLVVRLTQDGDGTLLVEDAR